MFTVFVFEQKTVYELRISDWSSDVCSSDLCNRTAARKSVCRPGSNARRIEAVTRRPAGPRPCNIITHIGHNGEDAMKRTTRHLLLATLSSLSLAASPEIGRASCRERVCQDVEIPVVRGTLTKKKTQTIPNNNEP